MSPTRIRQALRAVIPTILVAAAIEINHVTGLELPVPFLLLIASVLYASTAGGRVGGVLAGLIGAGEILHAHLIGIGPASVVQSLPASLASMAIFVLTGYFIGRTTDQRDALMARRLEEQRCEQEQPLLLAAKIARMGYCIWDTMNDVPVVVSDQHARNFGTTVEGFLASASTGKGAIKLVHPDDRAEIDACRRKLRDGMTVTVEFRVPLETEDRWIRAVVQPQTDRDGRVRREICATLDITEDKRNERLFAEAQRLDAVGRLTAGVAHDFNNILTVITGNLELADLHASCPDQHQLLSEALDAAVRGAHLTKQLLTFGRKSELSPECLDANQVIGQLQALLRRTLPSSIRLDTRLAADLSPLHVDRTQLESALLNLCINARDAMPDGGALLIETTQLTIAERDAEPPAGLGPGAYVVIAVIDSGSGIEKAAQDRVFEPFYTTKPVDKGSGLGLPMVYGFVVQSGGRITLESQPGQGTELRMYLPASATRPAAAAPGPTITATPTTGCARPRGRLIEDPDSLCAPAPPAGPAVKPRLPAVLSPTAEKGLS